MTAVTVCACGCGRRVTSTHPKAKYAAPACRRRAFEERIGYVPPRASKSVANGRERKPDNGVRVYFPSVEVAEEALTALEYAWWPPSKAHTAIKRAVDRKRATT